LLIQKRATTRDRHQFIAIAHSKKSNNKRSPSVYRNRSFKKEQQQEIAISLSQSLIQKRATTRDHDLRLFPIIGDKRSIRRLQNS
jgi:hypothetical protein